MSVCVCVVMAGCMSACVLVVMSGCVSACVCVRSEGWVSRGSYITAVKSDCIAQLVYTATLVRPDSVAFEYQKDGRFQLFSFQVSL